jgi:hypothetical protein
MLTTTSARVGCGFRTNLRTAVVCPRLKYPSPEIPLQFFAVFIASNASFIVFREEEQVCLEAKQVFHETSQTYFMASHAFPKEKQACFKVKKVFSETKQLYLETKKVCYEVSQACNGAGKGCYFPNEV